MNGYTKFLLKFFLDKKIFFQKVKCLFNKEDCEIYLIYFYLSTILVKAWLALSIIFVLTYDARTRIISVMYYIFFNVPYACTIMIEGKNYLCFNVPYACTRIISVELYFCFNVPCPLKAKSKVLFLYQMQVLFSYFPKEYHTC